MILFLEDFWVGFEFKDIEILWEGGIIIWWFIKYKKIYVLELF